jgi:hypothetical protein
VAGDQGSFDKVKGMADEYQAVAVLHPNIWYGRGPGQVGACLDNARRAGPRAIAPLGGWRQALITADCALRDYPTTSVGRALQACRRKGAGIPKSNKHSR